MANLQLLSDITKPFTPINGKKFSKHPAGYTKSQITEIKENQFSTKLLINAGSGLTGLTLNTGIHHSTYLPIIPKALRLNQYSATVCEKIAEMVRADIISPAELQTWIIIQQNGGTVTKKNYSKFQILRKISYRLFSKHLKILTDVGIMLKTGSHYTISSLRKINFGKCIKRIYIVDWRKLASIRGALLANRLKKIVRTSKYNQASSVVSCMSNFYSPGIQTLDCIAQSYLAQELAISPKSITKIVARLSTQGYLQTYSFSEVLHEDKFLERLCNTLWDKEIHQKIKDGLYRRFKKDRFYVPVTQIHDGVHMLPNFCAIKRFIDHHGHRMYRVRGISLYHFRLR